jgi:sugar phosphate isomerase/epimerase
MNLGFVSAILPDLSLNALLAFARAESFSCIEIMCWTVGRSERKFAGVTHIDVTGFTKTEADEANSLAAKHGVAISGLGYYPNPLDPDPEVAKAAVAHLKRAIVAAPKLGLDHLHAKDVKIDRRRLDEVGVFAEPLQWHQPRLPGFGEIDWPHFMGALLELGYAGPVCIEVEDDTFGKSLEGRKKALRVARNVLQPFFA